jgi:DNA repair exonuclease SbcCD nuclease subunit
MIYFAPDLHIGHNIKKSCKLTATDSYLALGRMTDCILKDKDAKAVVLPGDIFTKDTVNGKDIEAFTKFIDRLFEKGISVYTIQGNHDNGEKSIAASLGTHDLNGKATVIDGSVIYGLDYRPSMQLKEDIQEVPPCDVLVLHAGCFGIVEMQEMADITVEDIPKHVNNVVCGHIHRSTVFPLRKSGLVVSPGVLHPNAVDQAPPYSLFKFDGHKFEPVYIENRKLVRIAADNEEDLVSLYGCLDKIIEENVLDLIPFVELKFNTDLWLKVKEFELKYRDKCIFSEKPYSINKLAEGIIGDIELGVKLTLKDALPFALDSVKEPDAYSLLSALLENEVSGKIVEEYVASRIVN